MDGNVEILSERREGMIGYTEIISVTIGRVVGLMNIRT